MMSDAENGPDDPQAIEGYERPQPGGWSDYPLDELSIRDERRTAEHVVGRIEKGRFVMDPDFQRDFVWDVDKQSRLIESVLMRIPLPVFYVAEDAQGRLVVVDGRQRLTTLHRFMDGQLRLDLPDRPELHGKRFEDLDVRLQNRVEDCQLHFYIIDHKVPERARLDIFERVNGGEILTRQQMRNAVYSGRATRFLKEEAATDLFLEATGRSLNPKKMQDREFVNRFCAFSLLPRDEYRDMDEWLARALTVMNQAGDDVFASLRERLHRTLRNNLHVFGRNAFRKHRHPDAPRSIINASLFDVMSIGLADRDEALVREKADAIHGAISALLETPAFDKAITSGPNSPHAVHLRFSLAEQALREAFDAP